MQTRDQELSFGTKKYEILFIIDEDISPWKKTQGYLSDPVPTTYLLQPTSMDAVPDLCDHNSFLQPTGY